MTTATEWFGKLKSRAKSVQETAKTQIEKLTDTIDKKLKEAEDDLIKQRNKAAASQPGTQQQQKWQPSTENPDGEIVSITQPSSTAPSVIPTAPLDSQPSTPVVETLTIPHTKAKRRHAKKNGLLSTLIISADHETDSGNEQRNNFIQQKDNRMELEHCLNDIINEIVNREIIERCLNELIDIISIVNELVEDTAFITITQKEDLILIQDSTNDDFEDNIILENEESISSKTESDEENIQMHISIDELPPVINFDNAKIVNSEHGSISINIIPNDLLKLANTADSLSSHSDSNENHSVTSEIILKTASNELEDSFEEFKTSIIPTNRSFEKPPEKSTDLSELRDFISKIQNDTDTDDEEFSPKQHTNILDENVNNISEYLDVPNNIQDTLISSPISIPNEIQEEITSESPASTVSTTNEFLSNAINENTSPVRTESKLAETKRFSIVNCHSIPRGTKIYHINCSLTYIYICTNERKIFYAKLNINNMNIPLQWIQHSDLAEQIVVSISNRTVWRLFNKRLYSSIDSIKFPPIGSSWNEINIGNGQSLLSMSINDQCGWYVKDDGTLWLMRTVNKSDESINVTCPFNLNKVFCFSGKVAVSTNDGEILVRVGCTDDCLEGDGWIFIEHNFGPLDDFILLTNNNIICIVDKMHRLWIHQWSSDKGFFEILCNDDFLMFHQRYLTCVNSELLCFTNCEEEIQMFADSLTGVQWKLIQKNTLLQRLIGAFTNENFVWALTADKMICSSNGQILEKPRQAQYLTHATFVPDNSSQGTILWSLDESCNIYVRANVETNTRWEQLDQSQFEWNRRLVHIVCNNVGVWAVDDQGYVHFRHGHISASDDVYLNELSLLPPAWIPIPGEPKRYRSFSQIYCGPADWMVYATDNKQTVYARIGINEENRIGTSWIAFEECSALELSISEHTLWLLTSCGQIQCRENISITNPIGTRSTTLPGRFLSLTVSIDDSQVWALDSKRNLLKLDRLTVLFEK
ncbi:unnamed protein product [Rotaria sp. Silwood2]|nr:unnamed protein product [Rotaria sp. Silwood2]CAF2931234.1 unnamed protein product [Rotaria sp. Silwood2]CAF3938619.1 unnamed protein product [Rotaria sp. Silwood2]CAF4220547.1 unnamed protein product [Rotaria sp. Silwood2]